MSGQYGVARQDADTFRFTRLRLEPGLVGLLRRISDRARGTVGWRLDVLVVLRGPPRKVWPFQEDPLVATGVMTCREAKQLKDAGRPASIALRSYLPAAAAFNGAGFCPSGNISWR